MGASDEEEASLGNLQKGQTMSAHYSAHNERLSFGIKYKFIKACKLAAQAHSNIQSLKTACFSVQRGSPSIRSLPHRP